MQLWRIESDIIANSSVPLLALGAVMHHISDVILLRFVGPVDLVDQVTGHLKLY